MDALARNARRKETLIFFPRAQVLGEEGASLAANWGTSTGQLQRVIVAMVADLQFQAELLSETGLWKNGENADDPRAESGPERNDISGECGDQSRRGAVTIHVYRLLFRRRRLDARVALLETSLPPELASVKLNLSILTANIQGFETQEESLAYEAQERVLVARRRKTPPRLEKKARRHGRWKSQ